jgi:hypothetical protein
MNALPGIAAEIGFQQTGGDRVPGMRHHGEGEDRQYSLQQDEFIVSEAFRPVDGKGIADTGSARGIAIRTKANDLREIIGRTGGREPFE